MSDECDRCGQELMAFRVYANEEVICSDCWYAETYEEFNTPPYVTTTSTSGGGSVTKYYFNKDDAPCCSNEHEHVPGGFHCRRD